MSNEMFKKVRARSPITAEGWIKEEYKDAATMYVGLVQVERDNNDKVIGVVAASYGLGPASISEKPDPDPEKKDPDGNPLYTWEMQLQRDSDGDKRALRASPEGNNDTFGFVLAQLPGGRLTGWIHPGVELT